MLFYLFNWSAFALPCCSTVFFSAFALPCPVEPPRSTLHCIIITYFNLHSPGHGLQQFQAASTKLECRPEIIQEYCNNNNYILVGLLSSPSPSCCYGLCCTECNCNWQLLTDCYSDYDLQGNHTQRPPFYFAPSWGPQSLLFRFLQKPSSLRLARATKFLDFFVVR